MSVSAEAISLCNSPHCDDALRLIITQEILHYLMLEAQCAHLRDDQMFFSSGEFEKFRETNSDELSEHIDTFFEEAAGLLEDRNVRDSGRGD